MTHLLKYYLLGFYCLAPATSPAQANSSAAAGLAAGTALGASSSQSSTTASSAGSSNAPIEMNVMVYGGIKQISGDMAEQISEKLEPACPANTPCSQRRLLLEDSTTMPLVSLYSTWRALQKSIAAELGKLQAQTDEQTALIKKTHDDFEKAISSSDETRKKEADAKAAEQAKQKKKPSHRNLEFPNSMFGVTIPSLSPTPAATFPASTAASTAGASSSAATTPIGLTYLGDIGTALSTAKNGISYSATSISPATQALTTALANDLSKKQIMLYTSASTINLKNASDALSDLVVQLVTQNVKIQAALGVSTSLTPVTDAEKQDQDLQKKLDAATAQMKSSSAIITAAAATATQLINTFQSWQAGTDGNGGIVLTDAIRGSTLSDTMGENLPALQVNIDAAGGNTRTNSYFLFNLFYTPKPSFNAGVVVTYELRDGHNTYTAGDTLKALYDYSKWKPDCFKMKGSPDVNGTSLGTGRVAGGKKGYVECEVK